MPVRTYWTEDKLAIVAEMREKGVGWDAIAERFGEDGKNGVRAAYVRARKRGFTAEHGFKRSPPEGFATKGTTTLYRGEEEVMQWVKTDTDKQRQLEMMQEAIKGLVGDLKPVRAVEGPERAPVKRLGAYIFGDPHIGMLSWGEETGDDWDLRIAERIHQSASDRLIAAMPETEDAILVNLGDFFHYDGLAPVTPRSGHLLDADGRYARMIRVGMRVIRYMIEALLRKHERVRVVNAQGNHDQSSALFLSQALAQIYEKNPRLSVETSPSVHSYHRFGKCLIGIHHGHTTKKEALAGVMAADKPKEWGETEHRYWWVGHTHHQEAKEYRGASVEVFNTLAGKDGYTHAGGWRSRRNSKGIVLDPEHGEVERHTVSAEMAEE